MLVVKIAKFVIKKMRKMRKRKKIVSLKAEIRSTQSGYTDCGLLAIAYAVEIAHGYDPASVIFYQSKDEKPLTSSFDL